MLPSRRGQGGAAILIALIAALIILYILFLPPAERAALLGEGTPGTGPGGVTTPAADIVYSSPVGRVVAPLTPITSDDLSSVVIRSVEQGGVIASRTTALASNNVFEKQSTKINFTANPSLTRNAYLSMTIRSVSGGNLVIYLNGQEIYNRPVTSRAFPALALTNLQESNELEITTTNVGFAFWRTNVVTVSDLKVTGDVTDLSNAAGSQRFILSAEDLRDVKKAQLEFVPICARPGPVTLTLNDASLYEGTPDCENRNTLELAPTRLKEGENILRWSTKTADILIDLGRVTLESKKQDNKVFTFQIDPAKVAGRPVLLRVYYSDASTKEGYITVNDNRLPISGGSTYGMPITTALRPGANTVSFEAIGDPFEIVRFEVLRG